MNTPNIYQLKQEVFTLNKNTIIKGTITAIACDGDTFKYSLSIPDGYRTRTIGRKQADIYSTKEELLDFLAAEADCL